MQFAIADTDYRSASSTKQRMGAGNKILEGAASHGYANSYASSGININGHVVSYIRSSGEHGQVDHIIIRNGTDRPIDEHIWHAVIDRLHPRPLLLKRGFESAFRAFVNARKKL